MRITSLIAVGAAALCMTPAAAFADAPGKAYGKRCQGQSKQHVEGQKGTPFSQCVRAMARIGSGQTTSPRAACKRLSRKHVRGKKGTPFSRCVKAARKLKAERKHTGGDESYVDPFERS